MASVFKSKGSRKYTILYFDENGKRHKVMGCTDKAESERIANRLENEVVLRRRGLSDRKAESYRDHEARPVAEHLADWHGDMLAKKKTVKHADQYRDRAGKIVATLLGVRLDAIERGRREDSQRQADENLAKSLKSACLSHLTPEGIQSALATLLDAGKSPQTVNHYRAAIREFCLWLVEKRMRSNPMKGVEAYNVGEDVRHERRALTDDELARLIESAANGPTLFNMSGALRSIAYRTAAGSGLRVAELCSLTPENFRLDNPHPTVFVAASSTKNRKSADQPISHALAAELRSWIADKVPGESVFPLHHETAKAIRRDLEAAGIDYKTDEGVADFHSLRAYYVSSLIRSGATIETVRELARHAKASTTLDHYAKVGVYDLRGEVESLPVPMVNTQTVTLAATGTDPVSNATESATKIEAAGVQSLPIGSYGESQRFAKPLNWETGFGGSKSPPLRFLGGSDVARHFRDCVRRR